MIQLIIMFRVFDIFPTSLTKKSRSLKLPVIPHVSWHTKLWDPLSSEYHFRSDFKSICLFQT